MGGGALLLVPISCSLFSEQVMQPRSQGFLRPFHLQRKSPGNEVASDEKVGWHYGWNK